MSDQRKPAAWRWKPKGTTLWIYNPEAQWLDDHRQDGIDVEPLYAADEIGRLRSIAAERMDWFKQAANNVERLRSQLANARKALEEIETFCSTDNSTLGAIARLSHIRGTARQQLLSLSDENST